MASAAQHVQLSPAELAYLHASLSLSPPVRPDGRAAAQFRPLAAETGVLPGANGSARVCLADGTEAVVGVKAEVERAARQGGDDGEDGGSLDKGEIADAEQQRGEPDWVELTVEIPGYRDEEAGTVYLASMLAEALLADGALVKRLCINRRFHWRLYIDVLLISPPLSYPLPLLSLTVHLGLLATRLPKLKSEGDEDPLFDDDWAASTFLYPRKAGRFLARPPVSLLLMAVGDNIIFDPAKEELAVADVAMVVSVGEAAATTGHGRTRRTAGGADMDVDDDDNDDAGRGKAPGRNLRLLSIRTIDPPSRLTPPGVPNASNSVAGALAAAPVTQPDVRMSETAAVEGVWRPPRGGVGVRALATLIETVLQKGGVAYEVLDGLDGVELT